MSTRSGRTSFALTVSLVLHIGAAMVVTLYILVQKEILPNPFAAEFVAPRPSPKPRVRRPVIKRIPKPIAISETPIVLAQVTPTRVTRALPVKTSSAVGATALQFSSRTVRVGPTVSPATARGISADVDVPQAVTAANLPVSTSPCSSQSRNGAR